ncbi:class I SAM-dependent methyltransferase family protein, partial [Rhizobiaceae sp. 2RAB30]
DLYDNAARIVADAGAITVPTQLLVSGSDFVVRQAPQHEFFVKLGSPVKERHVLDGFFHDTLGEKNRAVALAEVRRFISEQYGRPTPRPDLTTADRAGHTRDEADRLATPLDAFSAKGAWWALNRAMIRIGAAFSEGLSTGVRTGFDSGSMLDYVYEDRSRGFGPGGRLIDRIFLDAVGWRGIRRRKAHLEELIPASVARLQAMGRNVDVLDIAAGHGRYVLDAIARCPQQPASVTLRDYSDINVVAGSSLIRSRGLPDTVVFRNGDAFNAASLAAQSPA